MQVRLLEVHLLLLVVLSLLTWDLLQPPLLEIFHGSIRFGVAYQGFRGLLDSEVLRLNQTVTSVPLVEAVTFPQDNLTIKLILAHSLSTLPQLLDVTLVLKLHRSEAEGDFGMDVVPVNYGGGGVSGDHDQTFMQATGALQQRGSDAKNAFVESVMPKTTSYQPQAYYAEDTPTMIQKNAHYTAETKAGIQNVFNSYQAPTTTARRGGNTIPRRMTKNANGTTISNEMKGAIGMGSVIGQ